MIRQGPTIGCLGVQRDQCRLLADVAVDALPGHPPVTYTEVGPPSCAAAPCPDSLLPGDRLDVTVQFAGEAPQVVTVDATGDGFKATDAGEAGLSELAPSSAHATGQGPGRFVLGHCGIGSPIDFDGSFWDPSGWIDLDAAASNASAGTLVLTSRDTAHFSTGTGFELDLVRHPGSKYFPGCM
jgi:hypothetical protein